MADTNPKTQKFSKGERSIPHHSQKASKYYPAEDVAVPKKVRSQIRQHGRSMPRHKQEEEDNAGALHQRQTYDSLRREETIYMLRHACHGPSLT